MPMLSQIEYLLCTKLGIRVELDFIDDVLAGVFPLEPCLPEDLTRCAAFLTVDERHFRVVRTARGKPLVLLPADS